MKVKCRERSPVFRLFFSIHLAINWTSLYPWCSGIAWERNWARNFRNWMKLVGLKPPLSHLILLVYIPLTSGLKPPEGIAPSQETGWWPLPSPLLSRSVKTVDVIESCDYYLQNIDVKRMHTHYTFKYDIYIYDLTCLYSIHCIFVLHHVYVHHQYLIQQTCDGYFTAPSTKIWWIYHQTTPVPAKCLPPGCLI